MMASVEAHLPGCGAGPGGPPTSWCPPFSGANAAEAQHHNPTRPRLLRIFPLFCLSFFLSFFPFILPFLLVLFFHPHPSSSFLLCLHSSLFHPSFSFLLCLHSPLSPFLLVSSFHPPPLPLYPFLFVSSIHPPTLPPLPSIDSRPLATLSSAILCLQLLCFSSEPPESRHQKRIRLYRPSNF